MRHGSGSLTAIGIVISWILCLALLDAPSMTLSATATLWFGALLVCGARRMVRILGVSRRQVVPGVVIRSEIRKSVEWIRWSRQKKFAPLIVYRFEINGKSCESDRYRPVTTIFYQAVGLTQKSEYYSLFKFSISCQNHYTQFSRFPKVS